ncbi:MAG: replication restart helicase PriA [Thermodesulfobacteriota bacterium]
MTEPMEQELLSLRVAVAVPVKGTFTYTAPDRLAGLVQPGCRVVVPFKRRTVTGYVLEKTFQPPKRPLKGIIDILDTDPIFLPHMIPFLEWISTYYLCPIGMVIKAVVPETRYKTATITEKGANVLKSRLFSTQETEILSWVQANPEKRLPWPLKKVYPLKEKGWLKVHNRSSKKGTAPPVMLKFVTPEKGCTLKQALAKISGKSKAKNEVEFLTRVFDAGAMGVSVLREGFGNGRYLINKWTTKKVLKMHSVPVHHARSQPNIFPPPPPHSLNPDQEKALQEIKIAINKRVFSPFLLYGVTGSGKTEVYYRAVEHALGMGRRVILMAPEISLAMYLEGLFRLRLGDRVAIYHSGLTRRERDYQWLRMSKGEADVVIGARSALFSPLPELGLIIVDEEHDTAYAQEEDAQGGARYHARDSAVVRAREENAVVVLGSGTPSVQSFQNSLTGRYTLLEMPDRVEKRPLPEVEIVDMKASEHSRGMDRMISARLQKCLNDTLRAGNQAILFLNRRGFHQVYLCPSCGEAVRCPSCDVSLTHHLKENRLTCHYCGFRCAVDMKCTSCGHGGLKGYGFGTERLEKEIQGLFPQARVSRMDTDSTSRKGTAFQILKAFSHGEIDILVGTQMITKGYDFPGVTLVGIISADLSLAFPDFRAGERTFQLLSQVSGRAGRGVLKGRVLVQTHNPDHYAICTATDHDYPAFFHQEKILRRQLAYPPFSHLACLKFQGHNQGKTEKAVHQINGMLTHIIRDRSKVRSDTQVLGPVEAPISRIKGKYRWQILIKCKRVSLLRQFLEELEQRSKKALGSAGVQLIFDVDPYQMT